MEGARLISRHISSVSYGLSTLPVWQALGHRSAGYEITAGPLRFSCQVICVPLEGTYHKRRDWKVVSETGFIVWYKNVFYLDKSLNCPHVREAQSVAIPVYARFWQNAPEFTSSSLTFAIWLSYTIPKQSCTYQMFMYIPRCSFRVKLVMRSTCMMSFLILAW